MQQQTDEQVAAWLAACERVVQARREHQAATDALVAAVVDGHDVGATWDDLAYAAGASRATVRRWVTLGTSRVNVMAQQPGGVRLVDFLAGGGSLASAAS